MTSYGWLCDRIKALHLLARSFTDMGVLRAIGELTAEYEASIAKERIRTRAYYLWEREGRPHGRDIDNWRQAEREMLLH
jgi:hypothetical protein